MEKQAFEPTGLIPRSIIRTVDRFVQQLLPGREKIALQEYRVSRYQILVSIKSLLTLILIPLIISSTIKGLLFTPLVEHFWNNNQSEIFLNEYQEKRAFSEMHDFSEKIFFESLLVDPKPKTNRVILAEKNDAKLNLEASTTFFHSPTLYKPTYVDMLLPLPLTEGRGHGYKLVEESGNDEVRWRPLTNRRFVCGANQKITSPCPYPCPSDKGKGMGTGMGTGIISDDAIDRRSVKSSVQLQPLGLPTGVMQIVDVRSQLHLHGEGDLYADTEGKQSKAAQISNLHRKDDGHAHANLLGSVGAIASASPQACNCTYTAKKICTPTQSTPTNRRFVSDAKQELILNETLQNQTLFQMKSLELAKSYNRQSILAITNLLGDFLTFLTVSLLFKIMRPELIILKSFLTESVYSLSDTTKSFLLILGMDLLVGFHSPRGWELALEGFLRHIGLPENENFILLFVALFPVFLDTVFKYWIFRYLNKISPSTVVTYHSMIE